MSVNVSNVVVVEKKGFFTDDILFDIELNCTCAISTYINFQVFYVGSATSPDLDKKLANVNVGPIEKGINRFVLKAAPPHFSKMDDIPPEDFALTLIMIKAYYKEQEFIRIGYYVSNTIPDDAGDNPDPSKIEREILTEDTTVFQNQIKWD